MPRRAAILLAFAAWCFVDFANAAEPPEPSPDILPGHSMHGEAFSEGPRQKAYLMPGTGRVNWPITARSPEAQQFFNQGVGQLHGFWYFEAERSFRQAAALDAECAMAYWGMAMANANNEGRAKTFIAKAVALKPKAGRQEQLWIDAAEALIKGSAGGGSKKYQKYINDLEAIVHEFPEQIEAKAFLALAMWHGSQNGLAITSRVAVDALMAQVLAVEPLHPVHHYRIHIWDDGKPVRALTSAANCGQSSPGVAHMWHMSGHIYSKLNRFGDAVWEQEAAARTDHAYMIRDRVMPYQIHNYAHNNEWCCRNLRYVGRVRESLALARNLAELPRHPKHNDGTNGFSAGRQGRDRLYDGLLDFELWDDVLRLAETPLFEAAEKSKDEVRRARLVGAAYFGTGDFERGQAQLELVKLRLKETEQAADDAARAAEEKARNEKQSDDKIAKAKESARKKHDDDLRRLREAAEGLRARRAFARGQFTEALAHFGRSGSVSKEMLSQTHLKAGDQKKALELAKQAFDSSPGQVAPLANYVDVLHRAGKTAEAAEHFGKLRSLAAHADMDLPVLTRLADVAQSLGYPADWRQPGTPPTDLGVRPDLASLGPFRWSPYKAENWHLADSTGKLVGSDDHRGKPVVLLFYLGHGCVHCIEQLNAFAPKAKDYAAAGISLVAVSSEPATDLKKSLDQCKLEGGFPFPLVSDSSLGAFRAYRAFDDFENVPLHGTYFIDGQGLVRWQDIGYQPFSDADFLLKEAKRLLALPVSANP